MYRQLTWCAGGSPALLCLKLLTDDPQDCGYGRNSLSVFAYLDPKGCWWKMSGDSDPPDWEKFFGIWPRWGTMRNGEIFQLQPSEHHIKEPEFGWLPTPTATANQDTPSMRKHKSVRNWQALFPGKIPPETWEWMMGFPIGYTDVLD